MELGAAIEGLISLGARSGARRVAIVIPRSGSLVVLGMASAGQEPSFSELSLRQSSLPHRLIEEVFASGRTSINDGSTAQVALSLKGVGASQGVLFLEFEGPLEPISAGWIRLVENACLLLAERAASSGRSTNAFAVLEQTGVLLGESLDYSATLSRAARLFLPLLGDACVIDIVSATGGYERAAEAHCDRDKEDLLRSLRQHQHPRPVPTSIAAIQRGTQPRIFHALPDDVLIAQGLDGFEIGVIRKLGLQSCLVVPLMARNRVIGAMAFNAEVANRYGDDDVVLATELARHVALAIDNARLFSEARKSKEQLSTILDFMPVSIMILEPGTAAVRFANRAADGLRDTAFFLGWHAARARGDEHFDGRGQLLTEREMPNVRAALGERLSGFEMLVRSTGGNRSYLINSETLRDPEGRPERVVMALQDVSAFKEVEKELRQSQKIEALGRLAGGIAHDFNNLLTVIYGYTGLGIRGMTADDPRHEFLVEIQRAGEKAAALTRQLLAYSRKQQLVPEIWDLNLIVADMTGMLSRIIGADLSVNVGLSATPEPAKVDRGQVEQVLLNLAVNARDAMPAGGRLTIKTGHVTLGPEYTATHPEVGPGPYVTLTVADSGTGMSAEVMARLFEPFFTTKAPDKGTGLGLSVVYGIIKQSGGTISIDSEVGRGSTVRIYLPRVDATDVATGAGAESAAAASVQGTESILLVEDEEAVRKFSTQALESHGYHVIATSRGEEAVQVLRGLGKPVDLVVTDLVMPGMGGQSLADEIARIRPGLPVLFISGYSVALTVRGRQPGTTGGFLKKPFGPFDLLAKVRESLDGAGAEPAPPELS
jgi:signal transduction histidine kinase/ActR/RegA family two-component response regulator